MQSYKAKEMPNYLSKDQKTNNDLKVKFNWNNKSINWYLKSECTTDFYKNSIDLIKPYLENSKTVLDIGCGIGSFSLLFANEGFEVTAVDKSSLAIDCLSARLSNLNVKNLNPINMSFEDFKFTKSYDIIFISYMMGLVNENNIVQILKHVNKHLILILPLNNVKNDFSINELYAQLGLGIKNLEQMTGSGIIDFLKKNNMKFEINNICAGFNQPFDNFNEAKQFIYHYFSLPADREKEIDDWLDKKIVKINNKLYLPNIRESQIITI